MVDSPNGDILKMYQTSTAVGTTASVVRGRSGSLPRRLWPILHCIKKSSR